MSSRPLARVVRVDQVGPIANAEVIEVAHVGGWPIVVGKGTFAPGDVAVYFEIDSFLPEGRPAWQFLVDKYPRFDDGVRGHVLRTMVFRGQVSQGLLLPPGAFPELDLQSIALGENLTERLGVSKYEAPIPPELDGIARGEYPSCFMTTDQERIQNLAAELAVWQQEASRWEITEKLEGTSCTFAWLEDGLHVCSRTRDLIESVDSTQWRIARALDLEAKLASLFAGRRIALQGELIGAGIEGNIYRMKDQAFRLYDVFDGDRFTHLPPQERRAIAQTLGIDHVPVIDPEFLLDGGSTMDTLLEMATERTALPMKQPCVREGLVFKRIDGKVSFKAISNRYLLKQKA